MSSDNVLPMSLEFSVTYVPDRFTLLLNSVDPMSLTPLTPPSQLQA